MLILETVEDFRAARRALGGTLAFVPTMGALHAGHVSLMHFGLEHANHLAVSIFINPTQFGPNEDLDVYPRDREGDIEKCRAAGCDLLFFPPVEQMYPDGASQLTHVDVDRLTSGLCGASRVGHFRGVTTVVTKLFNIVQPDVAVFGQKDYQQFAVLKQMARDLNMPIEVISAPTHREADGLAMSSRNRNLNPSDRGVALGLRKDSSALGNSTKPENVTPQRLRPPRALTWCNPVSAWTTSVVSTR
ncbi:MAG: pantoate--beta-alanine ligase [bacterium]